MKQAACKHLSKAVFPRYNATTESRWVAVINLRMAYIELVRRLEEQHHVFPSDPARINTELKHSDADFESKLWLRAQRIDSDQRVHTLLQQLLSRAVLLRQVLWVLWLVLGIFTAVGLMQTPSLNFFYVLVSVLGVNALMFAWWLVYLFKPQTHLPAWLQASMGLGSQRKAEHQALLALVREQMAQPQMKWWVGGISHSMWLASLGGLLLGVVMMLLVRQYTFSWQSTLLDQGSLNTVVAALAWLPSVLGLNVPDAHTVAASQSVGEVAFSRQWANLLWSSLLVYGLLPRLAAWLCCRWRLQTYQPRLPLDLPYYQRLKRLWQTQIVDSSQDFQADAKREHTRSVQNTAQTVFAAWESLPDVDTLQKMRPVNMQDMGVIDSRSEQEALLQHLQAAPVRLVLAVRLQGLPDRGSMRRFDAYADAAQGGLLVCLWGDGGDAERLQVWQQALNEQALEWQWMGANDDQ